MRNLIAGDFEVGSMSIEAKVNGKPVTFEIEPDTPLLWAIREELGMTGTKFGCGIAACGACSVHIDGEIARSCSIPVSEIAGKSITTIEGLAAANGTLNALQAGIALTLTEHGLRKHDAKRLAEDAVIRIQGALVVSRVQGDNRPFTRMMKSLPDFLLDPC